MLQCTVKLKHSFALALNLLLSIKVREGAARWYAPFNKAQTSPSKGEIVMSKMRKCTVFFDSNLKNRLLDLRREGMLGSFNEILGLRAFMELVQAIMTMCLTCRAIGLFSEDAESLPSSLQPLWKYFLSSSSENERIIEAIKVSSRTEIRAGLVTSDIISFQVVFFRSAKNEAAKLFGNIDLKKGKIGCVSGWHKNA